jgi:CTP:molybdopterin cytidylyltransferase MocA
MKSRRVHERCDSSSSATPGLLPNSPGVAAALRYDRAVRLTYIVLAAGASRRMGRDKLSIPLAGSTPLERLSRLLVGRAVVLVSSQRHLADYTAQIPAATVVVNESPQNGMTSSFRVAIPFLDDCDRVGVVLADKPLLLRTTLERLEDHVANATSDVIYPQSDAGEPGHPVYLSRRAIEAATRLPDGDTLRTLRNDATLSTRGIPCDDPGAYLDIDTEEDWVAAERFARDRDS